MVRVTTRNEKVLMSIGQLDIKISSNGTANAHNNRDIQKIKAITRIKMFGMKGPS